MTDTVKIAPKNGLESVHPEPFNPFTFRKHIRSCSVGHQTLVSDKHGPQIMSRGQCDSRAVVFTLFCGPEIML